MLELKIVYGISCRLSVLARLPRLKHLDDREVDEWESKSAADFARAKERAEEKERKRVNRMARRRLCTDINNFMERRRRKSGGRSRMREREKLMKTRVP